MELFDTDVDLQGHQLKGLGAPAEDDDGARKQDVDAVVASLTVDGPAGTPSLRTLGTGAQQACGGADARLSDTRTPTDATVTPAKLAASAIDPVAATAGARTLGTGAQQAAAGDDARLSDTRVPTDGSVTTAKFAPAAIDPVAGTAGARTLGTGAQQAAAGNDARLSDTRTPTDATVTPAKFAASAIDPVAGTAGARTLGTGAQQACAGDDARLSDTRTPTDVSVTTAKIVDSAVTTAKINDSAVTTAKVNDAAITTAKLADTSVTAAKIANATITDTQVAAANKDGVAGTASMRTLGTGGQQACAGNDSRLTDTRSPTPGTAVLSIPAIWWSAVDIANDVIGGASYNAVTVARGGANQTCGVIFHTQAAITVTGIRFAWKRGSADRTVKCALWSYTTVGTGTLIDSIDVAVTASGIYTGTFSASHALAANTRFVVSIWEKSGTDFTTILNGSSPFVTALPAGYVDAGLFAPMPAGPRLFVIRPDRSAGGDAFPGTGTASNWFPVEPVITNLTSF